MTVPYIFATQGGAGGASIPAAELDSNFAAVLPLTGGFLTSALQIGVSGAAAPTPALSTIVGYGVTGNIWLSSYATAVSAALNEVAGQSGILSNLGQGAGVEKVGFTAYSIGTAGSGPNIGFQAIGYGIGGAGGVPVRGVRISVANNGVDASGINATSVAGIELFSEGSTRATGAVYLSDPGLAAAKWAYGFIVGGDVITTAEWITFSHAPTVLQDNGTHAIGIDLSGGTYTDIAIKSRASTTASASIRLPHGVAPTSPVNGDMWTTSAGLYVRINGATVGPLS